MSIGPGQPISPAAGWTQEWQQLCWNAANHAIGHYFHGCANLAMARTPQHAMAALHATQTSLLCHLSGTFAEAARLWRKQSLLNKPTHSHPRGHAPFK